MLDLAPVFSPEAEHLGQLLKERDERNAGRIPLGISFLDDCLGGVYPRDLLLLGAASGVGKTALAVQAAMAGVGAGREVYLFALEAEVGEVGCRLYFEELGRRAKEPRLDYAGWWRGQWRSLDARFHEEIVAHLRPRLARLHTLYKKRGDFTPLSLSQQLEAVADKAGLIVLDHLHVIDSETDSGELRAQKRTIGMMRDIGNDGNVPVVVISHIRKTQAGQAEPLLPSTSDLHGNSEIYKVAKQVVVFGRDWDGHRPERHLSPTLMRVGKDRHGRSSSTVARMYYDMSTASYEEHYELGRIEWKDRRQQWTSLPNQLIPAWAGNEARTVLSNDGVPF